MAPDLVGKYLAGNPLPAVNRAARIRVRLSHRGFESGYPARHLYPNPAQRFLLSARVLWLAGSRRLRPLPDRDRTAPLAQLPNYWSGVWSSVLGSPPHNVGVRRFLRDTYRCHSFLLAARSRGRSGPSR